MKILERVKLYCQRMGLSQREFARRAGINPVVLSRFLNGKIRKNVVLKIDAFLDDAEQAEVGRAPKA